MAQIHKLFTDSQVRELMERYLNKEINRKYIQEILHIGKSRFFALVHEYRVNPKTFSIQYTRFVKPRIDSSTEKNIIKELSFEKKLIKNKEVALRSYNYSYIKDLLDQKYAQKVSLPTIIDRAKTYGFYLKKRKRAAHDREVLTHYAGQLVQHDSSLHLWAPAAQEKWYLITSLDDYSRFILYAALIRKESSWAHIQAVQTVCLQYGFPFSYYVDSHSIFRFVRGRDDLHYKHHLQTDEVDPQWKQVLQDCNVKVIYALSPQAKGKIERPYQWLQDRLVRTCARNDVSIIQPAQRILYHEIQRYNYRQVHSTTGEVPYYRFQRALREKISLFREFKIKPPYKSVKDIFCLRLDRMIDAYRKVSINNLQLRINGSPGQTVNIRFYPLGRTLCELRFWCGNSLIDVQTVKNFDLRGVQF